MTNSNLNYPKPIIYEPKEKANSCIIWLHGLGANGDDFKTIVPYLKIDQTKTRLVFPNAAMQPITINQGMVMPAWYDITHPTLREFDEKGVTETNRYIQGLIDKQIELGIASEKIILAGFSQGGAIAIYSATHCTKKLAGVLALSCYLLKAPDFESVNQKTPILMMHGTKDPVVAYELATDSRQKLLDLGYSLTFKDYPMMHEMNMDEINDITPWISSVLTGHS